MTGGVPDWPSLIDPTTDSLLLRDGSTAAVRATGPGDAPVLREFFRDLSPESRRRRFLASGNPADEVVSQMCDSSEPSRALTLVAFRQQEGVARPVAVASYAATGSASAEVAFAVADAMQGKGLGTALLERLAAIAHAHGFTSFAALELADNEAMFEVFRNSGLGLRARPSAGETNVQLDLRLSPEGLAAIEEHNRVATVASLTPMLRPRAVAVIGVSRDATNLGRRIFDRIRHGGFTGAVYAVNPRASEVDGVPCYGSIREVPSGVDLAVVATPASKVLGVLDDCVAAGIRSLLVVSAGFAEVGDEGKGLQHALVERARACGVRLIGPNCMGLQNTSPDVRLNASFAEQMPTAGGVALASQSGGVGLALLELAVARQLGISNFVSLGNKADVSGNDLLQWGESDPRTSVLLLYLESFGNPRRFGQLARRIARRKPIVVVKAGRTRSGSRAAGSHTAGLASNEAAVAALFKQSGVIRADTIDEMFDLAQCLDLQPLPSGHRVGIVTNTGGPGILAADACEAAGLVVAPLSAATAAGLASRLSAHASVANPVDLVASGGPAEYEHAIRTLLASNDVDSVMVVYTPINPQLTDGILAAIGSAVAGARGGGSAGKPVLLVRIGAATPLPLASGDEKIPAYAFPENAARALGRIAAYARWREQPVPVIPDVPDVHPHEARALCESVVAARGDAWLTSEELRRVLDAFGLPLVAEGTARTEDEAVAEAAIVGYPVVLKVQSPDVLHKTEAGGVALGLADDEAVRAAFRDLASRFPDVTRPGAEATLRVQALLSGVEVLVGIATDPIFGPLIAFGLGGVQTEVLHDVAFRMVPVSDTDVDHLFKDIRSFPLLEGFRGRPKADIVALRDVILRVSLLAHLVPELHELDLNPVIVLPAGRGCRIVDARARVARAC